MARAAIGAAGATAARAGWNWNTSNWRRPAWLKAAYARAAPFLPQLSRLVLLPIDTNPETKAYRRIGRITVRIESLDVKRLKRRIRYKPVLGPAFDLPQPQPQPTAPPQMRTRWDICTKSLFDPAGGRQRITVRFLIADDKLSFLWALGFPITVKSNEARLILANPVYDPLNGSWVEIDMLFDPNDPEMKAPADYNIALLVTDRDEDDFVVPLIIDPRMENNG